MGIVDIDIDIESILLVLVSNQYHWYWYCLCWYLQWFCNDASCICVISMLIFTMILQWRQLYIYWRSAPSPGFNSIHQYLFPSCNNSDKENESFWLLSKQSSKTVFVLSKCILSFHSKYAKPRKRWEPEKFLAHLT